MTTTCTMILGDCLEVMPTLPKNSGQMVFADIPYALGNNTHTKNNWDKPFGIERLFLCLDLVCIQQSMRLFSANDRLAAALVTARPNNFRYSIVVEKMQASLYFHVNKRPLLAHEIIQVFGQPGGTYIPQMTFGAPHSHPQKGRPRDRNQHDTKRLPTVSAGSRYPRSVLRVSAEHRAGKPNIHPTQKPVALLDWLIRTYSNAGDMVLDPTSGSGTTALSACQNGRSVTCIEKDEGYFEASVDRVRKHVRDNLLDVKLEVRK